MGYKVVHIEMWDCDTQCICHLDVNVAELSTR